MTCYVASMATHVCCHAPLFLRRRGENCVTKLPTRQCFRTNNARTIWNICFVYIIRLIRVIWLAWGDFGVFLFTLWLSRSGFKLVPSFFGQFLAFVRATLVAKRFTLWQLRFVMLVSVAIRKKRFLSPGCRFSCRKLLSAEQKIW